MSNSPISFAQNTSMANQLNQVDLWLYCVGFNNILSIFKTVVFGPATDVLPRLLIETQAASQRPATQKDIRTQELALERQTQLWGLSKF